MSDLSGCSGYRDDGGDVSTYPRIHVRMLSSLLDSISLRECRPTLVRWLDGGLTCSVSVPSFHVSRPVERIPRIGTVPSRPERMVRGFRTVKRASGLGPPVNVRSIPSWAVPLLVFWACGTAGVAVDLFDVYAILTDGPRWLFKLDVLAAAAFSLAIGGLDAYYRRHD